MLDRSRLEGIRQTRQTRHVLPLYSIRKKMSGDYMGDCLVCLGINHG